MTYNIPGVFTSVIDKSSIQPLTVVGRSVLLAGFSKYGELDKFYEFGDKDTLEFELGTLDIRRYGKALMYAIGALTKTRNVIFKRLMPDDATYANILFKNNGKTISIPDVTDADYIRNIIDQDSSISAAIVRPKEYEFVASEDISSVYWEHNIENLTVFVDGIEYERGNEYTCNGTVINFVQGKEPQASQTVSLYTIMDRTDGAWSWTLYFHHLTSSEAANHKITVPSSYRLKAETTWVTLQGLELSNDDIDNIDETTNEITFNANLNLEEDQLVIVHSAVDEDTNDNIDYGIFKIYETTLVEGQSVVSIPGGYNPDYTQVTVDGVMLGKTEYDYDESHESIRLSQAYHAGTIFRLHTIDLVGADHYYGALIAKAPGAGYNDLYVYFRPAPDVEKYYADEEGDVRYKFNFLKAVIFEETAAGQRRVSDEFVVSLIDMDPVTLMPIVSYVTGENLFVNDKFGASNSFIDFYMNKNFLPEFYKDLNIDELTTDNVGNVGANRFILIDTITMPDPNDPNHRVPYKTRNMELFVNGAEETEFRASAIDGKDEFLFRYVEDNGDINTVHVSMLDGELKFAISTGDNPRSVDYTYLDGVNAFYKVFVVRDPASVSGFRLEFTEYTENWRYLFYKQLVGKYHTAIWQMQNGYDGDFLIRDNRLNLGYIPGNKLNSQDAKQLLIDFYKNNEVIHEVLYPELDFDYVPDWTEDIDVMNEIVQLAEDIGFTMPIIALPRSTSPENDYKARTQDMYMSSFNTMIYSGQNNDNHYLETDGTRITCSPSYYAMIDHLNIDNNISITEPVANMVKGQLPVAGAQLSYIAKSKDIEKLRFVQINTIIKEVDGIYFIDQLTAYKAASKLSRANVVKVIHRMRKDLPRILKDLLQRKATDNILMAAKTRTERYLSRWVVSDSNIVDGIFSEVSVNPTFVAEEYKLIVSIAVKPIGTIEKIEVPITVY